MGKYSSLAKNTTPEKEKIRFVFTKGKYSGGEFFIRDGQKMLIGRDISSDVAIVDSKVSRNHASIISRAGRIFIEDNGSTNGTFVNGERIAASTPFEIFIGNVITIGDSTISVGENVNEKPVVSQESALKENTTGLVDNTPVSSSQNTTKETKETKEDEDPLVLDESIQETVDFNKISIAKVALKKGGPMTTAKTVADSVLSSSKGSLSAIDPVDLLKLLGQSSSVGYLILNITSPFEEKIEITIGKNGIVAAESISSRNFSQEKALSRFLLARDGEYEFKIDEAPRREDANSFLEDVFMEISNQRPALAKYRKITNSNQLRFIIPITGKLSDLSKPELESLQFMVNTGEVMEYLNMFPDNDDFILLSEILKFVDLGILFGDNNEEHVSESNIPDDILQM